MSIDAIILTDRQTDRQTNSVFLPYLFTYRNIKVKTAGGGASHKGYHALTESPFPGGLFLTLSCARLRNPGSSKADKRRGY